MVGTMRSGPFRNNRQSSTGEAGLSLRLDALRGARPIRRIAGRNLTKADILVYRLGDCEVALKDYGARPFWARNTIGRLLVRRESRAYAAAAGLEGLPRWLGRVGPFALAVEWVPGTSLAEAQGQRLNPAVFDRLGSILERIHERGIALGDLHHRDVIVGVDGGVSVVDLATAFVLGPRPGRLAVRLFRRMAEQDRVALARLRARAMGMDENRAVAALGPSVARRYARARRVKAWWDRLRGRRREANGRAGGSGQTPPGAPEAGESVAGKPYNRVLARVRLAATFLLVAVLVGFARPTPSSVTAGFAVAAVGEAARLWAAGHLLKTRELVTSGPYRYTRNPLYFGRLLIFTGLCVMCLLPYGLNWLVLLCGYAAFFGYYLPRKERVEPARLSAIHGEAYERYRQAVPALFPSLKPYPDRSGLGWSSDRMMRNREPWMVIALVAITAFLLLRAYAEPVPPPEDPAVRAAPGRP